MRYKIGFIGGGNMSQAILSGLTAKGSPYELYVCDRNENKRHFFTATLGVKATHDYREFIETVDVIVLAIKPQGFPALLAELKPLIKPHQLILSIAAGIPIEAIARGLGQAENQIAIVRAMPNTPSSIGLGATGLYGNTATNDTQKAIVSTLFESCGAITWLQSEALISAVVAVSGSSPAYFFYIMDIMTKVGESMGLDPESSLILTQQAMLGAARYSQKAGIPLETLKKNVMSPKGTTEQAVFSLERDHLDDVLKRAMQAAYDRDQVLSKEIGDTIV